MAEFEEADLRPFSSVSRPRTSVTGQQQQQQQQHSRPPMNGYGDAGARPMTAMSVAERQYEPVRPMTSSGRAVASGPDGPGQRPVTGGNRPKTGYHKGMMPAGSRLGTAVGGGRDQGWQVDETAREWIGRVFFLSPIFHPFSPPLPHSFLRTTF